MNQAKSWKNSGSEYWAVGSCGTTVNWDSIQEPGAYVCNWSGHLVRVPSDCAKPAYSPMVSMFGTEPLYVTKICDNPFVTITKARLLAANYDLPVSF